MELWNLTRFENGFCHLKLDTKTVILMNATLKTVLNMNVISWDSSLEILIDVDQQSNCLCFTLNII